MSDTPRTDEMTKPAGHFVSDKCSVVTAGFARELERELAAQKIETQRAGVWAAGLSLDLHFLKSKVTKFVKGVGMTPWKTTVPRVLGFKDEFDAMVTELAKPETKLPNAEAFRASAKP